MRVLCTSAGDAGHLEPTLPVARAPRRVGDDVAYAGTVATERAARGRTLATGRRPDVVVRDELDLGAALPGPEQSGS